MNLSTGTECARCKGGPGAPTENKNACSKKSKADQLYLEGCKCLDKNDKAGAAREFQEALNIFPDYGRASFKLACVVYDVQPFYSGTESVFAKAESLLIHAAQNGCPEAADYLNLLHRFGSRRDGVFSPQHGDEIEAYYEATLAKTNSDAVASQIHENFAIVLTQNKKYELAEVHFKKSIELNPSGAYSAWSNCGSLLSELNRLEEALECYTACLKIRPNFDPAKPNLEALMKRMSALSLTAENETDGASRFETSPLRVWDGLLPLDEFVSDCCKFICQVFLLPSNVHI